MEAAAAEDGSAAEDGMTDPDDGDASSDDSIPGFGVVGALFAIIGIMAVLVRRQ